MPAITLIQDIQGIHLRSYAQKNPEQEYKRESFTLFQSMLGAIKSDVVQDLARVRIATPEEIAQMEEERRRQAEMMKLNFEHHDMGLEGEIDTEDNPPRPPQNVQRITLTLGGAVPSSPTSYDETHRADEEDERLRDEETFFPANINRNAPCPCGSGLKYKQCHGKI